LAAQLGISYENAALLAMFVAALFIGLMAISIKFLDEHKFVVFSLAFTATLVIFTISGWFPLWLLIIILVIGGLILKQRMGK
jgi:predicted branched-subunit amino acid permease